MRWTPRCSPRYTAAIHSIKRAMEPHGMVNGGNLNPRSRKPMPCGCRATGRKLRSEANRADTDERAGHPARYHLRGSHLTMWFCDVTFQWVMKLHRRTSSGRSQMNLSFSTGGSRCPAIGRFAFPKVGHQALARTACFLMFETRFWCLERGSHIKIGLPF